MTHEVSVVVKSPRQCLPNELAEFVALVLAGGEVAHTGLQARLRDAHAACLIRAMTPNPSLHPTCYSWLRQPPHASELQR